MITRRSAFRIATGVASAAILGSRSAYAADQVVKVGIDLSFTGADAETAARIANGAILAFEDANAAHTVKGVTFDLVKFDDATATAGQYDPAQAATNARKMVSDKDYIAAIGPQMSGAGKAMSPILSAGNLATITPSSTNPDITDPKFAAAVPAIRQGGLLPYRRDGRLSGPEHGQLHGRKAEDQISLRSR